MEKYKAVIAFKDVGNSHFLIINKGKCLYKDKNNCARRDVGFVSQKDERIGDAYEIEFIPEGTKHLQNPYCRKVKKIDCNAIERLHNIIEMCEIACSQIGSTSEEWIHPNNKYGNFYFMDNFYFMKVETYFEAIELYFKNERNKFYANKVKEIITNFAIDFYSSLNIGENEKFAKVGENFDPVKFIGTVKKKHFSIFTSNQKVADFVHKKTTNTAMEYYKKLKDVCNCYIKEIESDKNKIK